MSSGHSTMTGFLTVILALVLVIAGLIAEWPYWMWATAAAALALGTWAAVRLQRRREPFIPPEHTREPHSPCPPVECWERVLQRIPMPTGTSDYDCLFSATVRWRPEVTQPNAPVVNHAGLAVSAILERACLITAHADPHRLSLTEQVLSGDLAVMQPDRTGRLLAMADDVRLTLTDADRERLEKLATVRKNEAVWEHERKWEMSKRTYLKEDVLRTTGSAVVWWLAKNDDKIDKTVSDIGLLTELASAANDQNVPEGFHRFVPGLRDVPQPERQAETVPTAVLSAGEHVHKAMDAAGVVPGDPRRGLFVDRVAHAASATELHQLATALGYVYEEPEPGHDREPGPLGRPEPKAEPEVTEDASELPTTTGPAEKPDDASSPYRWYPDEEPPDTDH